MEENIAKLIFDYTKNRKYADYDFIKKIVYIYSKENNLLELNDKLCPFDNKSIGHISKSFSGITDYDFLKEEINNIQINFKRIKIDTIKITYFITFLSYNIMVALTVLHELDHAKNFETYKNNTDSLDKFYYKYMIKIRQTCINNIICNHTSNKDIIYYLLNSHDQAPEEAMAIYISHKKVDNIISILEKTTLNKVYLKKIRSELYNLFLLSINTGYIFSEKYDYTNSPSIDYLYILSQKLDDKSIFNEIKYNDYYKMYQNSTIQNSYSLEDKIRYKLPLNKNEFHLLNDKKINIFKN